MMINTAIMRLVFEDGQQLWIPASGADVLEKVRPSFARLKGSQTTIFEQGKVPFEELPKETRKEVRATLENFRQSNVYYEHLEFTESPNSCIKSDYASDQFFAGTYHAEDITE